MILNAPKTLSAPNVVTITMLLNIALLYYHYQGLGEIQSENNLFIFIKTKNMVFKLTNTYQKKNKRKDEKYTGRLERFSVFFYYYFFLVAYNRLFSDTISLSPWLFNVVLLHWTSHPGIETDTQPILSILIMLCLSELYYRGLCF